MTKAALIAQVAGEAYHHMLDWRYEVDSAIIQNQIDQKGKAIVIVFGPSPGIHHDMQWVTELPAPGTARPHCGSFGGGYEYCFLHTPAGWMLKVTNFVQDSIRFGLTKKIPPLLIDDTAAISVTVRHIEDVRGLGPTGLMDDSDDDRTPTNRATFPTGGEFYDKLLVWGWTPEQMTEYNYLFHPLSVGCEIMVEHPESGTKNHLTKDVGW
jgi:hypothetical protein